ncbi:hypothetical protein GCM10027614_35260 [Micromonospora vulcania]
MGWLDRVDDQVDALTRARALQEASRSAEAYALLERVIHSATDPTTRADAMVQRLSALINLGRTAEFTRAIEEASAAVRDLAEPYLHGHLNALAALAAHHQGALDRCVTHLVKAARALSAVEDPDRDTAWGWHDLAMAYSYLSFHGYALGAIERARQLGLAAGIPEETFAAPGIRLRNAVALDHNGDSDGCLRVLRDVAADLNRFLRAGRAGRLRPSSLAAYGYAAARQAALGDRVDSEGTPSRPGCSATAGTAPVPGTCVSSGRSAWPSPLGGPSRRSPDWTPSGCPPRRSARPSRPGCAASRWPGPVTTWRRTGPTGWRSGSPRSATTGSATSTSTASPPASTTRRCAEAARFEGEALTDPLTGLPNRRRLERYITAVVTRGERVVIGVCDLDGFKAVNTRHGHHSGDLVLQRIAGVINRVMRRGDFVARYGGDEFVVVLPDTGMAEAVEVARRIEAAVGAEDWESLVPETPVGVSIGFAEVSGGSGLRDALSVAFEEADREMLRAKTRPRAS